MDATLQAWIVGAVVLACALHAAWRLLPAAARRALAARALQLPLPAPLARALRRTLSASGCGGCSGCGDDAPTTKTVTLHRRPPRG